MINFLIFVPVGTVETYIIAELAEARLVLRVKLQGPEEQFTADDVYINDGEPYLLHVSNYWVYIIFRT